MSVFDRFVVATIPIVPKSFVRSAAMRYVAGETIPEMVATVKKLNGSGALATVSVLGEHVHDPQEARGAVKEFVAVLDEIAAQRLDAGISVKPTQIGLLIDPALCEECLRAILESAKRHGNFVRIDMEDSSCTSGTIELFRKVRRDYERVGIVIQAYLRRSYDDVRSLAEERADVRVCKGIYIEPRVLAYKDPEIIRRNFMHLVATMMQKQSPVAIATHDERLVWEGLRAAENLGLGRDRFEFQMLLGVDDEMRKILVDAGYRVRVYVPFGPQWYAYSTRRLRENPRIARYVLQGILRGR